MELEQVNKTKKVKLDRIKGKTPGKSQPSTSQAQDVQSNLDIDALAAPIVAHHGYGILSD